MFMRARVWFSIGHQANYSVDNTDERWGVRYNRKAVVNGSNQDRLRQAMRAAATACQRLEAEPRLGGKIRFNGQEMEFFVNDRLLAPHSDSTRGSITAGVRRVFREAVSRQRISADVRRRSAQTVSECR